MTDKKEDLKSFQIGATPSFMPGTGPVSAPATSPAEAPAPSAAGNFPSSPEEKTFPNIETLLETEELQEIGQKMGETCQALDQLIERRSGRIKKEAQQARLAYERTFDLIDHLMEIKSNLLPKEDEETS